MSSLSFHFVQCFHKYVEVHVVVTQRIKQKPLSKSVTPTLREMCPYLGFFWSLFSRIRTEFSPNEGIRTRKTLNTGSFQTVLFFSFKPLRLRKIRCSFFIFFFIDRTDSYTQVLRKYYLYR